MQSRWSRAPWAFLLAFLLLLSPQALANTPAQPVHVPIQGLLADARGVPVDGAVAMRFALYASPSDSEVIWSESLQVDVEEGLFSLNLGTITELAVDVFETHSRLYLEIAVGTDAPMERFALGATPYAAFAHRAHSASHLMGLTPEAIQQRARGYFNGTVDPPVHTVDEALDRVMQRLGALEEQVSGLQSQNTLLANEVTTLQVEKSEQAMRTTALENAMTATQTLAQATQTSLAFLQDEHWATLGRLEELENDHLALVNTVYAQDQALAQHTARLESLETKTAPMSLADENGHATLAFSGVNVAVRSGAGGTELEPNGLGNLIIGYNEPVADSPHTRAGSHNLVLGVQNTYESVGAIVAGSRNHSGAPYASVIGGFLNTAKGQSSVVLGGARNETLPLGIHSIIAGGKFNKTAADSAVVTGGRGSDASGIDSLVAGGSAGMASGEMSAVFGGHGNEASGDVAAASGGRYNRATGAMAMVCGGEENLASMYVSLAGGGFMNQANGSHATALGGSVNQANASGTNAFGGRHNRVTGMYATAVAGLENLATEIDASTFGGYGNMASGTLATAVGGSGNVAEGPNAAVFGGAENTAIGGHSTITAGIRNYTQAEYSSVSGGYGNGTQSVFSSISGGANLVTDVPYEWRGGGY